MRKAVICTLFVFISANMMSQTQVIAHRGFWDTQGSAQNSIASLLKADSINCYGSEFDVRMSSDGKLIVIHDAIHGLTSIKKNTADTLTRLKLKNGESLPLLSEYLQKGTELKTRLILELKKLSTPELETKAIEQIISLVSKMQLEPRMEYISFSLHAVKEFIRLAPQGTPIYYLNGDLSPQELKAIGCTGPDYNSKVFKKNPEWITECHSLGLKVNVWTVNSEEDMQWLIKHKVDFITTDRPLVLRNLLKNY